MSVRLAVILCQSSSGSPAARDLEGDLVARLIGSPGLDLSLVGSLDRLDPAGTDKLLLGGLLGDLAILSWHAPEKAIELCHLNGIKGYRARHSRDELGATEPPVDGPAKTVETSSDNSGNRHSPAGALASDARRLYLFDLSRLSGDAVAAGLLQLLQARRTQTVSISIAGQPLSTTTTASSAVSDQSDQSLRAVSSPGMSDGNAASEILARATAAGQDPKSQDPESQDPESQDSSEWDQLVEELNDLDI